MDLILWRHAEAEDWPEGDPQAGSDMDRSLTARGEKQAVRMAAWLDRQLPEGARILVSPARRCEQTALALNRKYRLRPEIAPGASPAQLLELVQWPLAKSPVLVIGHQPTLGMVAGRLINGVDGYVPVKKGAVWWFRQRERDGESARSEERRVGKECA